MLGGYLDGEKVNGLALYGWTRPNSYIQQRSNLLFGVWQNNLINHLLSKPKSIENKNKNCGINM